MADSLGPKPFFPQKLPSSLNFQSHLDLTKPPWRGLHLKHKEQVSLVKTAKKMGFSGAQFLEPFSNLQDLAKTCKNKDQMARAAKDLTSTNKMFLI